MALTFLITLLLLLNSKTKSVGSIGGPRHYFGGNSGYRGYSMSNRAAAAREDGRFPKTDFKQIYNMPSKTFDFLVKCKIINNNEWHHTSSYGNRTTFYRWDDEDYIEIYRNNKIQIDNIVKEYFSTIGPVLESHSAVLNAATAEFISKEELETLTNQLASYSKQINNIVEDYREKICNFFD